MSNIVNVNGTALIETCADNEHPRDSLARMQQNLLPCPFCGMLPTIYVSGHGRNISVKCNCKMAPCTPLYNQQNRFYKVTRLWNQRNNKSESK